MGRGGGSPAGVRRKHVKELTVRSMQAVAVITGLLVSLAANPRNGIEPLPRDLEMQLALSALPPHLRDNATVYVLNPAKGFERSEEHTSELQSRRDLVCRLLLEKKKKKITKNDNYLNNYNKQILVTPK